MSVRQWRDEIDAAYKVACDLADDVAKIAFRNQAVQLRSADQAVDRSSAVTASVGPGEQPVLLA